jgi:GMP synthase PP-ATPase subunit
MMEHSEACVQIVVDEAWSILNSNRHYNEILQPILQAANFSGTYFEAATKFREVVAGLPPGVPLNLLQPHRDKFADEIRKFQYWMDNGSKHLEETTLRLRNQKA